MATSKLATAVHHEAPPQARTLAQSIAAAIDRQQRQAAMLAILKRLDDARREHADHYLAERLRRETSAELS